MELPVESFIKPVPDSDDLFAFTYDFALEGKALGDDHQVVTEAENGDLIIEGFAAVWDGEDREGENFAPGAFERGIKSFLGQSAALCFHHKRDHVLGKVLQLEERDKGLYMKARVDGAIRQHPVLGTIYHQIKNGTLSGLSVGGWFKRAWMNGKRRIADMDFSEISVTGVPIHTGPSFAVIAGKALGNDEELPAPPEVEADISDEDVAVLENSLTRLDELITRIESLNSEATA